MELEKLQNDLNKEKQSSREKEMETFINQLEEFIKDNNPIRNNLEKDESICVVKDRKNERLTLVNISNGDEFDIFIAKSQKDFEDLKNNKIFENIYGTSEKSFYNIDLGTNIILKDGNCEIYNKEITIKNKTAMNRLEELYFNLNEEEGIKYIVDKIENDKIYLKGEDGGYFSIYKQAYPEFKENDKVIRKNRKYIL